MKKSALAPQWEMMRLRHGIGLRCVEALPADKLDARPVKNMRTPRELVVHFYSFLRSAAESVPAGELAYEEDADLTKTGDKASLVAFVNESWKAADAAFAKITDEQLAAAVKAPWGGTSGGRMITTIFEEYLHHRGQLYVYLRLLGVEPPQNFDFEGSAPEFRPRQHA